MAGALAAVMRLLETTRGSVERAHCLQVILSVVRGAREVRQDSCLADCLAVLAREGTAAAAWHRMRTFSESVAESTSLALVLELLDELAAEDGSLHVLQGTMYARCAARKCLLQVDVWQAVPAACFKHPVERDAHCLRRCAALRGPASIL